ncbi:hypothetical protein C5167_042387 [Papaver somniferum]|uniref:Retrotransposon gag domain-containing protein n=1 Tax=Papaver somniferum TaxID=3469 RepID=A0A4Y7L5V1_PAPSO|nr:hypothetical protein C5167_042387 [Papaver somniferum]
MLKKTLILTFLMRMMTETITKAMTNQTAAITALILNQNGNHNAPPPPPSGNMNDNNHQGGSPDPLVVDKWKEDLDKIFVAMRCTLVQRKQLVVFQLSWEERKWWKNASVGLDLDTLTYAQFFERFDVRYFPVTVRNKKIKEFVEVAQLRGELVDDYLDKYIIISRFVLFMIPDEEKSARKFEQGLRDHIRNKVVSHCFPTFQQVVESARATEADWLMYKKTKEERHKATYNGKKGSNYQHHGDKNYSSTWKKQRTDNFRDQEKKIGDVKPFPFHFYNRKENGHKRDDCPKPIQPQFKMQGYRKRNSRMKPKKGQEID